MRCASSIEKGHVSLQVAKTLPEQISQYAQVVLQTLAYAGTGDVLQIQSLLAMCGEHTEVDESAAWKVSTGPFL
jgi:26S proteasome regulatory subunit N1